MLVPLSFSADSDTSGTFGALTDGYRSVLLFSAQSSSLLRGTSRSACQGTVADFAHSHSYVLLTAGNKIDAALAGFALTFSLNVANDILFLVRRYSEC